MEVALGIALGLSLSMAVALGVYCWDLRKLGRSQEKELWALRQALRMRRDDGGGDAPSVPTQPTVRA